MAKTITRLVFLCFLGILLGLSEAREGGVPQLSLELATCEETLTNTDNQLTAIQNNLTSTLEELTTCQDKVPQVLEELATCEEKLTNTDIQLTAIQNNLTSTLEELATCQGEEGPEMKTVVIAGLPDKRDVEILSLEETNITCLKPQDYPLDVYHHATVLYNGKITVCGGYNGTSMYASCYQLNALNNSWMEMPPMTQARDRFGAVVTPYGLMVTGGYNRGRGGSIDSVEYFNGTTWQPGPSMPASSRAHCAVQLNSTHTAVIGGARSDSNVRSNVYVFDWTQQQWSEVQSMHSARTSHSCVMLPNGNVFVVGSYKDGIGLTTEVYNPVADQWTWGPPLPFKKKWLNGDLVLVDEKPTLVGGLVDGARVNRVFQLVGPEWVQLETTLNIARQRHTVTQVPVESLPGCTEN